MKIIGKLKSENGITLILLIIIILILVVIVSLLVKCIFDFKTIGATQANKIENEKAIGKYVEYSPDKGMFSYLKNNAKHTGNAENSYDFVTDESLNWRIWKIDENTITLISDKPTSVGGYRNLGALNLSNYNGYNNAVKVLNDICKKCYSNAEYNAISRSLNVDDIENVLNTSVWNPGSYITKRTELNYLSSKKEYTTNVCYPYIYGMEKQTSIDNKEDNIEIENEEKIQRSEQKELICEKYLKAQNVINPTQTAWINSRLKSKNFINQNYYYLIFKEGFQETETLMSYFLASRAVDLEENYINFDVFEVSMGKDVKTNTLFNSRGGSLEYWNRIRPVVEIPLENIKLDKTTDGMTAETAWKIEKK